MLRLPGIRVGPRTAVTVLAALLALGLSACEQTQRSSPVSPIAARLLIEGVVHESFPSESVLVGGVSLTLLGGEDDGATVVTDEHGYFDFGVVALGRSVRLAKPGYLTAEVPLSPEGRSVANIAIVPNPTVVSFEATDYLCPTIGSVTRCLTEYEYPQQLTYRFPVHHDGQMLVELQVVEGWDHVQGISFEIRKDGDLLESGNFSHERRAVFDDEVAGGVIYEVRVLDYLSGSYVRGQVLVRITHPS